MLLEEKLSDCARALKASSLRLTAAESGRSLSHTHTPPTLLMVSLTTLDQHWSLEPEISTSAAVTLHRAASQLQHAHLN